MGLHRFTNRRSFDNLVCMVHDRYQSKCLDCGSIVPNGIVHVCHIQVKRIRREGRAQLSMFDKDELTEAECKEESDD